MGKSEGQKGKGYPRYPFCFLKENIEISKCTKNKIAYLISVLYVLSSLYDIGVVEFLSEFTIDFIDINIISSKGARRIRAGEVLMTRW